MQCRISEPSTVPCVCLGVERYTFGSNVGKSGVALRICWAHDPRAEAAITSTGIDDSSLYLGIGGVFCWLLKKLRIDMN